MPNPFDQFDNAPQPVRVGSPDPYRAQQQRQDLTKGGLDITGKQLDIQSKQLEIEGRKLKLQEGEVDEKAKADERLAAFLATRIKGGIGDISSALKTDPKAVKPTVLNTVAGVLGEDARGAASSSGRRTIEDAQLDVLDAALTLGTGAAYTREQLEGYRESHFPSLTDDPANIAAKQQRLMRLLEAAKIKAGAAAPLIDQAIAAMNPTQDLTPDQVKQEMDTRLRRGDDPATVIQWLISINRPPSKEDIEAIIANRGNPRADSYFRDGGSAQSLAEGFGGIAEGVGDLVGLVSNPFIAGVNAVTGSNYNPDMGQNFREFLGLPEAGTPEQKIINALGGAAIQGGGLAGVAKAAAPMAGQVVGGALSRFGAAPGTDMMVAGAGGASGETAKQMGAGPTGQILAALGGGALSVPAAMKVSNAFVRPQNVETALTSAGKQEGVTVNRAMVDPNAQQRVTAVGKTMVGGRMMQRDIREVGNQIEGRVKALSDGQPLEPSVAGQRVERALERSIESSGARARYSYSQAEQAAGGAKIRPRDSSLIVDEMLTKLRETPETNKAEIAFLEGLRKDFDRDLTVGALRDLRTTLRKKISRGELTFGQNEKRVLDIIKAAGDDIEVGLTTQNKRAAAELFKRADAQYAERMDLIQNTIQKVIGKRGAHFPPERIIANVRAMATKGGDAAGLHKVMAELAPSERGDVAATFADALGKDRSGGFSTAALVSNAEKMPRAARVAVFGPDGAKSLENLEVLAREHKRVSGALGGSPTGAANDWRSWLATFFFGGIPGGLTGDAVPALATAGTALAMKGARDAISARLLMSKNVSNWLRNAPRTSNPKAINTHFDRLKAIAAREPALAAEIEELQRAIFKAANENVTPSVAASEPDQQN